MQWRTSRAGSARHGGGRYFPSLIVSTAATLWTTVLDLSPSLFSLSALAAMRLVASRSGPRRFASLVVPALGAIALAAVIGIDVVQSDATTRAIDVAGTILGLPFALWRRRRTAATAATSA